MTLSERIASLGPLDQPASDLEAHFRVIEMHVARAEEVLLRYERTHSSWTKPELTLRMMENA